jgi:ABC-type amino acid transport substrate-binding protein
MAIVLGLACHASQAGKLVLMPPLESGTDTRGNYPYMLLQLVLSKAGGNYEAGHADRVMLQGRALVQLEQNQGIDVVATMTSADREKRLLPIRIPLDKGLLGWRVFLVRSQDKDKFESVTSLDQLRRMRAGQGHDWPDAAILRANGMNVTVNSSYDALFQQLSAGRFDFFPRSANEVIAEQRRHPGLEIEPRIALHYPAATYFFVNRNNTALAADIERGLRLAMQDGSFDRLFEATFSDMLRQLDLGRRITLELDNPFLPDRTPLTEASYWYRPRDTVSNGHRGAD